MAAQQNTERDALLDLLADFVSADRANTAAGAIAGALSALFLGIFAHTVFFPTEDATFALFAFLFFGAIRPALRAALQSRRPGASARTWAR